MTQGYIIQFYHPIESDLPEDMREDWMQMHHEELIRDNKVFETVQLKLDIQMGFFDRESPLDKMWAHFDIEEIVNTINILPTLTKKKLKNEKIIIYG